LSLFGGIALGEFILNNFSFLQTLQSLFSLFSSLLSEVWILKTLGFILLVGSIMELIKHSGGVEGFVELMQKKIGIVKTKRSALMLSYIIGIFIFIESTITSLIAGAVGKPFCQRYSISNAKLAFVCDSTSAPISSLIVLNGWGALLLGLIVSQIEDGVISGDGVDILIDAVAYNFYAISALLITFLSIYFDINIGPMRYATVSKFTSLEENRVAKSFYLMLLPVVLMVFGVFVFLYITGDGDILRGSGSSSIFYTMLVVLLFMFVYYVFGGYMGAKEYIQHSYKGVKDIFSIALILLFAFAIGKVTTQMNTGLYLASLASDTISVYMLFGVIFLLSSVISFSTGTSWGTFSIMIPVALPMAVGMGADISLSIAAVISGGVFGDHCSPISDTTIISSMASGCDVVEHVKTQLPYALISGLIALILFIVAGFVV
jgi:Na+/H+ antiporter NhaC